ncbi:MAG: alpha-hydroxy-acid oxidizing protein [Acetobacteraceae bacterium]|nr:alpha-hydroxy-acid oxidizing protein [Acetobacteraceae bacterium]
MTTDPPSRRGLFLAAGAAGAAGAALAPARPAAAQQQQEGERGALQLRPTPRPYPAPTAEQSLRMANLLEIEEAASRIIPEGAFAYIASGADNEWTLHENRRAFDRYPIRPHYLSGPAGLDLRTTLLGQELSMPILTAPMGAHGLAHASAEVGTARGTGEAGTLMTIGTAANRTIEDIAKATPGPKWFQIYLMDDAGRSRELLQRAKAAGCSAIVFTIDAFAPGASDRVARLGFSFPPNLPLVNSGTAVFKRSLTWDDVAFIQRTVDLPLVLKGVLTADVARAAIERGVAAIQVSNHGGRQLDGVPAALDALPPIAEAVAGRVPVIMDSGIRRGTDVFKALALGADAVALGRPVLYGLALGGWMGVKSVYDHIRQELTRTMTIAGARTVKDVQRNFLF